ncbi:MAG: addiction module protein [Ignavibacteriota bacterium]|nr:addiction module antitoxin RelB [Ignavibacteriota bacterium]MBW7842259.1 addiction module protein [Ignavibacterium sp.]MCO6448376.1 addiction module protein [Ignavibacterium album]QKK00790.1 MAG: addiction module protein [Ignavibacteriota bacterium]HOJ08777.1 addiction module protein [Ignavibacteriaceae bacterium]
MSELTKKITDEALLLPREARAELVDKLLQSLNAPSPGDIDKLWAEEAENRISEYDAGKVQSLNGLQVIKELRDRYKN